MLTLGDLSWIFLLAFVAWYWWKAKAISEFALKAAQEHCRRMDVLLLDQAVFLRGLWFKRDGAGRMRVWRRFLFEFSTTGESRYTGRVILLGLQVESVQLDPHRISQP